MIVNPHERIIDELGLDQDNINYEIDDRFVEMGSRRSNRLRRN